MITSDIYRIWSINRFPGSSLVINPISRILKSILKMKDFKIDVAGFLAISATGGFFTLVFMLVFVEVPSANEKILYLLAGNIVAGWIAIIMYHYGSSAGSTSHSETIARALDDKMKEKSKENK